MFCGAVWCASVRLCAVDGWREGEGFGAGCWSGGGRGGRVERSGLPSKGPPCWVFEGFLFGRELVSLFSVVVRDVPHMCPPKDGSTQFIVTCGQDGDFTPVIGMISPMATCGAPLAFPSATVISEVTSVSYPGQVRYMCLEGHSLDGKWENASDMEHTTNMMFASACTLDGAFSVETDPCVPVACGLPPAVEFATSSSAHVSLVYGESAQYHCDHGHTVDGNAASNVSFAVPCNSNGNFTLRPQDECKPVVCSRVPVVPNTLPLAASGLSGSRFLFFKSNILGGPPPPNNVRKTQDRLSVLCEAIARNGEGHGEATVGGQEAANGKRGKHRYGQGDAQDMRFGKAMEIEVERI